jgi:hypothetical protein
MTFKTTMLRWGRALRRARDLFGLVLLTAVCVLRNRASRQRWQSRRMIPQAPSKAAAWAGRRTRRSQEP